MAKVLITGGAYQGKYRYARDHYPIIDENCINFQEIENRIGKNENSRDNLPDMICQKVSVNHMICFTHCHLLVKWAVKSEIDIIDLWESICDRVCRSGDWCVIMDEIGGGIIPLDRFEREYREKAGIFGCYIAGKSDEVVRVICGIGSRIK